VIHIFEDLEANLGRVMLTCEATVAGERLVVRQVVANPVWNDPEARDAVERSIRHELMHEILKRWSPVIRVQR
jgi:hypothetical protein